MKKLNVIGMMVMTLAVLALGRPVAAFAEMKEMPMKGHGQMMGMDSMDKMGDMSSMCIEHAEMLGLTDEQIKKIKPAHLAMQKRHAQFKADLKIAEIDLMEVMEIKDFDMDKAIVAVKRISEIKTAHHLEALKTMKEIRTVLTEEQFKKMQKMMSMNMQKHKLIKKNVLKK